MHRHPGVRGGGQRPAAATTFERAWSYTVVAVVLAGFVLALLVASIGR